MNTIPKLKINQERLDNDCDIKDLFFHSKYRKKIKFFWNQPDQIEITGIGTALISSFSNSQEFENLSKYYRDIIKTNYENLKDLLSPIIFTVTSFDINRKDVKNPWLRVPKGTILIPSKIYIKKNNIKRLITITSNVSNKESENTKINTSSRLDETEKSSKKYFHSIVGKAVKKIAQKNLSKIVLSRQKVLNSNFNAKAQANFLLQAETNFPHCVNFIYDFQDKGVFFGVTPETLFKIKDKKLYSEALAGTFKSSSNIKSLNNSKELDEHNFVVTYLKERISEISDDVKWSQKPELIHLNQMAHLKTKFTSKIKKDINPFKVLYQLHPTPAVCGTPINTAMNEIHQLEEHDRGWYAGTMGWIDHNYNSHFIVSIRSGMAFEKKIYLYAGCGITKDSDKDIEYTESEMKFNSILSTLNYES